MLRLTWRFWWTALLMLTLFRLCLVAWQWPRVEAVDGFWPVMLGGLRIDLVMIGMMIAIPAGAGPFFGHFAIAEKITAWWFRVCWFLLLLLEVSTPQFIAEYDTRPNRLYFEYLGFPREVFAMLWEGYRLVLLSAFAGLGIGMWGAFKLFKSGKPDKELRWWLRPLVSVVLILYCVGTIRGTLQHRPINASSVAFGNDAMVNALPLNGLWSVANAAYLMKKEKSSFDLYGKLPIEEINEIVRRAAGIPDPVLDSHLPTLHAQTATVRRDKPLNLVIIMQESMGAQYSKKLGGARDLTPELDKLAQEGWWFERAYATGTRSVRGLEAVSSGFLPTPAQAVLTLPRSQTGFFTIAELLGRHGYYSRFIYGGEGHFDNMRSFFLGNGFNEMLDLPKFVSPKFVGSWGASDEDMFTELDRVLRQDTARPTVTMAFSVSNHSPWEYPKGRIEPIGEPATVTNTVRYADWAIGDFFKKARQSPYWDNTLFLIVADHDARVYGGLVPVRHFHIPALIIGPGVKPKSDAQVMSQIDLLPTLLSLMGMDTVHPMLGRDLTRQPANRAMMQFGDNYGFLTAGPEGEKLVVLEPGKPARTIRYEMPDRYTPTDPDEQLSREALAHVLWPSWAYREQRYALPPRSTR
jgi:phosphoglycerol transferase MdoB-like AlkP superfamily enzyme